MPARQFGHVLSDVRKPPTTNWPGAIDVTSSPTCSTTPQYSCPMGVGWGTGSMLR
jgi:hypothetical protein